MSAIGVRTVSEIQSMKGKGSLDYRFIVRFSKEWEKEVRKLKNSGYNLSTIPITRVEVG